MKKNLRVVQINGFRGLFLSIFIICCIIAGFVVFPAFLTMNIWNFIAIKTGSFPAINIGGGILLLGIIVLTLYLCSKKKFIVCTNSQQELTEDEVREVVTKIKSQAIKHNILLPGDFPPNHNCKNEKAEDLTKAKAETKEN